MLVGRSLRIPGGPIAEDQSLIGMVADRTAFHVLGDINGVLRRAGINMDYPGSLSKIDPELLVDLAPILGCDEADILARATPLMNPKARSSALRFGATIVDAFDFEANRRRISPLSLQASPHHRQAWMIKLLPYCPVSLERLRSECSKCGLPLRWKSTRGVGRCDSLDCDHTIEPTDAPPLDCKIAEDYRLFADLFSPSSEVRRAALSQFPSAITSIDPRLLIDMIVAVGACAVLPSRRADRKTFCKQAPDVVARVCATGTALLKSWPIGVRAWAAAEAQRLTTNDRELLALRKAIRRLGIRTVVSDEQSELIKAAFPDLFGNVRRAFASVEEVVLRSEASGLLGVATETINILAEQGAIVSERMGSTSAHIRFLRSDILEARRCLDQSLSTALMKRTTGLPFYAIDQLRAINTLTDELHPVASALRGSDSVTKVSLAAIVNGLEANRDRGRWPELVVPIGTATRRFGGNLKPWANIVTALADGSLPFWSSGPIDGETNWAREIMVQPADMSRFDDILVPDVDSNVREDCSLTDAREILNLQGVASLDLKAVFSDDVSRRQQVGPRVSVSTRSVLELAANTISIAEICARTGWNQRHAKWRLAPYQEYKTETGWSRSVIESAFFC